MPVVLARDVHIRRFNGYGEESERAIDFKEDVQRAWNQQPGLSNARKLDILLENVGPIVRDELRCQPTRIREDAEEALSCIISVFGEKRSPAILFDILRQTRQHQGETVRLFSHRIRAAFNALTSRQATLKVHVEDEITLREHFINAVNCQMLSRYLAEKIASDPALSFLDVREIAIRWARDEDSTATVGTAAVAAAPQVSPTEARLDRLERMMGDQASIVTDLANSVKMLLERQSHTSTFQSHTPTPRSHMPAPQIQNRRNLRQNRQQRTCFRCERPGHFIADCPVPPAQAPGNSQSPR